jgi:hypothetical protein
MLEQDLKKHVAKHKIQDLYECDDTQVSSNQNNACFSLRHTLVMPGYLNCVFGNGNKFLKSCCRIEETHGRPHAKKLK